MTDPRYNILRIHLGPPDTARHPEFRLWGGDILQAAEEGNVGAVRRLLQVDPHALEQVDQYRRNLRRVGLKVEELVIVAQLWLPNPLLIRVSVGTWPTVDFARGVAIISGAWGDGPLANAAWKGHLEVVQVLLAASASVEAKNDNGCGPQRRDGRDRTDVVGRRCNRRNVEEMRHAIEFAASFGSFVPGIFSVLYAIPCWEVNYQYTAVASLCCGMLRVCHTWQYYSEWFGMKFDGVCSVFFFQD